MTSLFAYYSILPRVSSHRPASFVLAAVLVPAGCVTPVPCGDPASICLATDDLSHVRVNIMPDALVVADLDGDGARDLVGASSRAGTITVVWGDETGFTASATTWSIDQEVAGIVVADLDADGRLDLATALPRADAVAVLRGRGARSFSAPERHPAGAVPRALIAAELDGAGPPELITADLEAGTVTVLHQFVAAPAVVVGPGPRALAAGDLDSDGHLDVAVALADTDAVQVLRGDGERGLSPAALHPVGAAPYDLVVADLDADGHLDIATADSLDDSVSVLFGDGAGDLRERTAWPTVALPTDLVVVRPPGEPPVLGVLSAETSEIQRLDPRSGEVLAGALASEPLAVADVAGTLVTAGAAIAELSPGTGLSMTPVWHRSDVTGLWPVDLDGDGIDELLLLGDDNEPGTLTLRRDDLATEVTVGLTAPDKVLAADLTGDGRVDLLLRQGDVLVVVVQRPDGALAAGLAHQVDGLRDVVLADIDGDAVAEIVLLSGDDGTNHLDRHRSDDAGTLALVESSVLPIEAPMARLRVLDGDGDERPDLVLDRTFEYFYLEDASGPPRRLLLDDTLLTSDLAFADLDADDRLDALFCGLLGPQVVHDVLADDATPPVPLFAAPCQTLDLLDLDGDGDNELLVGEYIESLSSTRLTPWVLQDGQWLAHGSRTLEDVSPDHILAKVDGGGGPPELVVRRLGDHAIYRLDLGPALIETPILPLSIRPRLRFGDIDGDGAADLFAFGHTIAVARADGRGGFGPQTYVWTAPTQGSEPLQLHPGLLDDLDHDGDLEFVGALSPYGRLFAAGVSLAGLTEPVDLGVFVDDPLFRLFPVDLDHDGRRDILTLDLGESLVGSLLRGRDDGSFAELEPLSLADGFGVLQAALHDMDGDGEVDIVAVAVGSGHRPHIRVYPGAGDGTFSPGRHWADVFPNNTARELVVGDFDRDGRVELVATKNFGDLVWLRGGVVRPLLEDTSACTSADLDRDGHPELLATVAAEGRTRLYVGRSRSDGSFGFTTHDIDTTGVWEIHTTDIDGDGALDIILSDSLGATIVRRLP